MTHIMGGSTKLTVEQATVGMALQAVEQGSLCGRVNVALPQRLAIVGGFFGD